MPCSVANFLPSLPCARLDRGSRERRLPWKRVCGRAVVLYAGAGTSGRLAVQDGAELMPTFGWPRDRLLLFIAGGEEAMVRAKEGAEDEPGQAIDLVRSHGIASNDVLMPSPRAGLRRLPWHVCVRPSGAAP